jgi:hypothetical protein
MYIFSQVPHPYLGPTILLGFEKTFLLKLRENVFKIPFFQMFFLILHKVNHYLVQLKRDF